MKNKILINIAIALTVLVIISGISWIKILRSAHSSFENYSSFRGCIQLLSKTSDLGYCIIESGEIIKIVKFNDRWYLDGDLPTCWKNICL